MISLARGVSMRSVYLYLLVVILLFLAAQSSYAAQANTQKQKCQEVWSTIFRPGISAVHTALSALKALEKNQCSQADIDTLTARFCMEKCSSDAHKHCLNGCSKICSKRSTNTNAVQHCIAKKSLSKRKA